MIIDFLLNQSLDDQTIISSYEFELCNQPFAIVPFSSLNKHSLGDLGIVGRPKVDFGFLFCLHFPWIEVVAEGRAKLGV